MWSEYCLTVADKRLLSLKRREQIETVEQVWKVEEYARQYKAITLVSEAIFPVSTYVTSYNLYTRLHIVHIECTL